VIYLSNKFVKCRDSEKHELQVVSLKGGGAIGAFCFICEIFYPAENLELNQRIDIEDVV